MGLQTRNTATYDDAILRLVMEDEDGQVRKTRSGRNTGGTTGRTTTRKPQSKAVVHREAEQNEPVPPTVASKAQAKQRRNKRREDRIAQNQEERDAHDMDVFFPDMSDADNPGKLS